MLTQVFDIADQMLCRVLAEVVSRCCHARRRATASSLVETDDAEHLWIEPGTVTARPQRSAGTAVQEEGRHTGGSSRLLPEDPMPIAGAHQSARADGRLREHRQHASAVRPRHLRPE